MAVRIEQPQPLNAAVARDAGAGDVMTRNNPAVLNAYELAIRSQQELQARRDAARRDALAAARSGGRGGGGGDYDNIQQGMNLRAQLQARELDRGLERDQMQARSAAVEYGAQVEAAQQQAAAQNRVVEMQTELTTQERMKMQRMQQATSDVMNDPTLDPLTKRQMVTRLRTGLDVYQAREQQAEARMREQQAARMAEEQKLQDDLLSGSEARRAAAFNRRMVPFADPETGRQRVGWLDNQGNLRPLPEAKEPKDAKVEPFDIEKTVKAAQAEATLAFPDDMVNKDTGKTEASPEQLQRRNNYATQVFTRERAAHQQPGQQQGQQPGQQPAATKPPAWAKPFEPSKPGTVDGPQKLILADLGMQQIGYATRPDLSADERAMIGDAFKQMIGLIGKHGYAPPPGTPDGDKIAALQGFISRYGPPVRPAQPTPPAPPVRPAPPGRPTSGNPIHRALGR